MSCPREENKQYPLNKLLEHIGRYSSDYSDWINYYSNVTVASAELNLAPTTNVNAIFGTVGIGTTSPNRTLTLVGNMSSTGGMNFSGVLSGSSAQNILTLRSDGTIEYRTPAQILIDIGAGSPGGGVLQGSGTTNYIPRWTGAANLGNSQIFDNNTNVGIGITTPNEKLTINGNLSASGILYSGSQTVVGNISATGNILASGNVGIGITNPASFGTLAVQGSLFLSGGNSPYVPSGLNPVDAVNLSGTYIAFGPAGSVNDWAYLRQIGGSNDYHMTLDLHDDGDNSTAGQGFSIRAIQSVLTPDASPLTRIRIDGSGNVGIGTANPDADAILQIDSTTKGFLPPRMTITQRNAIAAPIPAGLMVYNTTTNLINYHNGTTWFAITGVGPA